MEIADILNQKNMGAYQGYWLQQIYTTTLTEYDVILMDSKLLQRVPRKISYFLNRSKISKVFRTRFAEDPRDDNYMVLSTDGTMFEAVY